MTRRCPICHSTSLDRGRAADGRRAYRCRACGHAWTEGMQGRERRYSEQRPGDQFADTGAARRSEP
jgi:transposase-like protein